MVVRALFFDKPGSEMKGDPVAQIVFQDGQVQFRPDNDLIWQDVENNQYLFENDNIATGENGLVIINFGNNKTLELSTNTQIRIKQLASDDQDFEIDLIRGNLTALSDVNVSNEKLKTSEASIRTGDKVIQVDEKASKLSISKKRGENDAEIAVLSGQALLIDKDKRQTLQQEAKAEAEAQPVVPAPEPKPLVHPEPKKPLITLDTTRAKLYMPQIVVPTESQTIWALQPLQSAKQVKIPIYLDPPKSAPEGKTWRPMLGAVKSGMFEKLPTAALQWTGEPYLKRQSILVSLDELEKNDLLIRTDGDVPTLAFKLKPGVVIANPNNSGKEMSFADAKTFQVGLLGDLKGTIAFKIAGVGVDHSPNPWLIRPKLQAPNTFDVVLQDAESIPAISPILAGSRNFEVDKMPKGLEGEGIYLVRSHKIVGKLQGAIPEKKVIALFKKLLNCDFIYEGKAKSYIGSLVEFRQLAKSPQGLPERIYILNNGQFIGISKDFMQKNKALQKFLDDKTSAFFSEPIKTFDQIVLPAH